MKALSSSVFGLVLLLCCNTGSPSESSTECSPVATHACHGNVLPSRGPLRPSDLPAPVVFSDFEGNSTIDLPGGHTRAVATGHVTQINNVGDRASIDADFAVVQSAVDREDIDTVLGLLRSYDRYDEDPDTVDGMPTYEIFLDSPELKSGTPGFKILDGDPGALRERTALRKKIRGVLDPYLNDILTPYVRVRYPKACERASEGRACTPCYSLIRRYRHGERQSHATHHDGHAIVTVVVSLSDYGRDYRGGLYVSTGFGQHEFMGLQKGDAAVHQSSLLHGVKVYDLKENPESTERWSWILWYRDSDTCQDFSHEWFAECAEEGDALCQQLHSTKVGHVPGLTQEEVAHRIMTLNREAAEGGAGTAAVKIARAYLKLLPSSLPYDEEEAKRYYEMAIRSHSPDGHYGMAQLLLASISKAEAEGKVAGRESDWKKEQLSTVVRHLEAAAYTGHAFSMFNLGIAHVYGYGFPGIDTDLAAEWFVASGLPEGYFLSSQQAAAVGDMERKRAHFERAQILGFFAPWRQEARQRTGSGGAGGVDLNMPWPSAADGRRPPMF